MLEYIERDKVLAEEEFFGEHATWDNPMTNGCMAVRSDFIMNIPAADVRPVKRGKWHDCYQLMSNCYVAVCSLCREKHEYIGGGFLKFCPNCGADMVEG